VCVCVCVYVCVCVRACVRVHVRVDASAQITAAARCTFLEQWERRAHAQAHATAPCASPLMGLTHFWRMVPPLFTRSFTAFCPAASPDARLLSSILARKSCGGGCRRVWSGPGGGQRAGLEMVYKEMVVSIKDDRYKYSSY